MCNCPPLVFIDNKTTLVQAMAWCHQAPSHYLIQCWPFDATRGQWGQCLASVSHTIILLFPLDSTSWEHQQLYHILSVVLGFLLPVYIVTLNIDYSNTTVKANNEFCSYYKVHFLEIKFSIFSKFRWSFQDTIDNKPTFVQVMAWSWTGDRPLVEPMRINFTNACMHH